MAKAKTNGKAAHAPAESEIIWRGPDALRPFLVPVDRLHEDPANVNTHDERSIAAISASYARFGQQKALVSDASGVVRDGNGQLRAAADRLGWSHVAVVTSDLTGSDLTAYAVAVNRVASFSAFDPEALATTLRSLQSEDFDLAAVGYEPGEVDALIEGLAAQAAGSLEAGETAEDPGAETDRAEELQAKWKTARGQLWVIESKTTPGREHRLICGDCTSPEAIARLCPEKVQGAFTSPPYAEQRKDQYGGTPADKYVEWWEAVQANVRSVLKDDGSFFVNIKAHREDRERNLYVMDLVCAMKRRWDWRYIDELCWVKNGLPTGNAEYFRNDFEPIHHFAFPGHLKFRAENVLSGGPVEQDFIYRTLSERQGKGANVVRSRELDGVRPSNVIKCGVDTTGTAHAAAFPVALPEFFLKAFSDPGDTWLEPFCGSGTTIVAAEATGRIAYGIELAEAYVAVILERLSGLGLHPRLSD